MFGSNRVLLSVAGAVLLYAGALLAFQWFAMPVYSDMARWLAWVLFVLGTWPIVRFLRSPKGLPLIELVLLNYVLFFSLPLFYQEKLTIYIGTVIPRSDSIELTLLCAIIAVVMLQLGFGLCRTLVKGGDYLPQLRFSCNEPRLFLFAVGTLVGRICIDVNLLPIPSDLLRVAGVLLSGDLGIAILSLLYYRGSLSRRQRILALALLAVQVVLGLSSGMTQNLLQPVFIWYLCRWFAGRGVPYRQLAMLGIIFLLLQPVKLTYRQNVWFSGKDFRLVDKLETYNSLFWSHWLGEGELAKKVSDTTSGRLSLLLQSAHVIERTPSMVPYKNGETLMYMVYSWVPRFLWAGKPIAQQANVDFALAYGIQSPGTINTARFGIGHLGEAYINFGLIGIFVVMFCLGWFYYLPLLLIPPNIEDVAAVSILAAVLVNFIFIGSTIGNVFGSAVQQVVVQGLMIRYFMRLKVIR